MDDVRGRVYVTNSAYNRLEVFDTKKQRFLAPILGWGLWGLAALALVPALARRAAPLWNAGGDAFERHPALATWGAVVFAILLVGVWPDRVRFTGDFLLRQGTVEVAERHVTLRVRGDENPIIQRLAREDVERMVFPEPELEDIFLAYYQPRGSPGE